MENANWNCLTVFLYFTISTRQLHRKKEPPLVDQLQHGIALVAFQLSFGRTGQQSDTTEQCQVHGDVEDACARVSWFASNGCNGDHQQQTTNNKQHTTHNRQQTTDNRQQTTNNKQQTTNNKQQTTNNKQQQQQLRLRCGPTTKNMKPWQPPSLSPCEIARIVSYTVSNDLSSQTVSSHIYIYIYIYFCLPAWNLALKNVKLQLSQQIFLQIPTLTYYDWKLLAATTFPPSGLPRIAQKM